MAWTSRYRYYLFLEPSPILSLFSYVGRKKRKKPRALRVSLYLCTVSLFTTLFYLSRLCLVEDRKISGSLTHENEPFPRKRFFFFLPFCHLCRKPVSCFLACHGQIQDRVEIERTSHRGRKEDASSDRVRQRRIRVDRPITAIGGKLRYRGNGIQVIVKCMYGVPWHGWANINSEILQTISHIFPVLTHLLVGWFFLDLKKIFYLGSICQITFIWIWIVWKLLARIDQWQ